MRRDRFVSSVRQHLPHAQALGIEAGLHVVLRWSDLSDDVGLGARLAQHGVKVVPLSGYYADRHSPQVAHGIVCGYARLPESQAEQAALLIRDVVSAA